LGLHAWTADEVSGNGLPVKCQLPPIRSTKNIVLRLEGRLTGYKTLSSGAFIPCFSISAAWDCERLDLHTQRVGLQEAQAQ
jgi:hypothetical protein